MEISKVVDVCGVKVDIYSGAIGCSLSGGADSASLAYILLKHAPGPINFYTTDQKPWPNRIAGCRDVYQRLLKLVPRSDTQLIETVIPDIDSNEDNLFLTPKDHIRQGIIQLVYTGVTSNPPGNPDFGYPGDNMPSRLLDTNTLLGHFYIPYINYDKKKISEIYQHYDLMETIFPYTASCVESKTDQHCGDCWWCAERKWAFGRLV